MISKELLESKLLEEQTQELARIYKQNQRFHNFSKVKRVWYVPHTILETVVFGDNEKVSKRVAISNLLEIVSTDEFKDKYLYICRGSSNQKPVDWISKVKREIQLKETIF